MQRRPLQRLRRLGEVIDFLVGLRSLCHPLGEQAAVFADGAVEFRVWVLFPGFLLHDLGCVQLFGVELLAEVELARDELVGREDGELDVVAVRVVLELEVVLRVAFPAELGRRVEVEDLDVVRAWVDEQVPRAEVAVNDAESEVEVVDNLYLGQFVL